jgi:hypothetical protein
VSEKSIDLIKQILANPDGSFLNDDTFSEHLESANFKSIKEILIPPMTLIAMSGNCKGLSDMIVSSISSIKNACQLSWVLHTLRVLYK